MKCILSLLLLALLCGALILPASAGSATTVPALAAVTLDLLWSGYSTFNDAEGAWQVVRGTVFRNGNQIGYFAMTVRTAVGDPASGTNPLNTAMANLTLFIQGQDPPQNVTLQGSHSYNNGDFVGGVSAASAQFKSLVGGTAVMTNAGAGHHPLVITF